MVNEEDILVVIFPNLKEIKGIIVLDPFDKRVKYYSVDSIGEVKEILKIDLPFCSQNHEPIIHIGNAYIIEWESLPPSALVIKTPDDIERALS